MYWTKDQYAAGVQSKNTQVIEVFGIGLLLASAVILMIGYKWAFYIGLILIALIILSFVLIWYSRSQFHSLESKSLKLFELIIDNRKNQGPTPAFASIVEDSLKAYARQYELPASFSSSTVSKIWQTNHEDLVYGNAMPVVEKILQIELSLQKNNAHKIHSEYRRLKEVVITSHDIAYNSLIN